MDTKCDSLQHEISRQGPIGLFTAALFHYLCNKIVDFDVCVDSQRSGFDKRRLTRLLKLEPLKVHRLGEDFGEYFTSFLSKFGFLKRLHFFSADFVHFLSVTLPALLQLISVETCGHLVLTSHVEKSHPKEQGLHDGVCHQPLCSSFPTLNLHLLGRTQGCGQSWIIAMVAAIAQEVYDIKVVKRALAGTHKEAETAASRDSAASLHAKEEHEAWELCFANKDPDRDPNKDPRCLGIPHNIGDQANKAYRSSKDQLSYPTDRFDLPDSIQQVSFLPDENGGWDAICAFYIMLDVDLSIKGYGKKLGHLLPQLKTLSSASPINLYDVFNAVWAALPTSEDTNVTKSAAETQGGGAAIRACDASHEIVGKSVMLTAKSCGIQLKGHLVKCKRFRKEDKRSGDNCWTEESDMLIFVGAPYYCSAEILQGCGLMHYNSSVGDGAASDDLFTDFMLLVEKSRAEQHLLADSQKRLLESQLCCNQMKDTISKLLLDDTSARQGEDSEDSRSPYSSPLHSGGGMPISTAISVIDRVLLGETLDPRELLHVREALVAAAASATSSNATSNLFQQSNALQTIAELGGEDQEVQLALQQLLSEGCHEVPAQEEEDTYTGASAAYPPDIWLNGQQDQQNANPSTSSSTLGSHGVILDKASQPGRQPHNASFLQLPADEEASRAVPSAWQPAGKPRAAVSSAPVSAVDVGMMPVAVVTPSRGLLRAVGDVQIITDHVQLSALRDNELAGEVTVGRSLQTGTSFSDLFKKKLASWRRGSMSFVPASFGNNLRGSGKLLSLDPDVTSGSTMHNALNPEEASGSTMHNALDPDVASGSTMHNALDPNMNQRSKEVIGAELSRKVGNKAKGMMAKIKRWVRRRRSFSRSHSSRQEPGGGVSSSAYNPRFATASMYEALTAVPAAPHFDSRMFSPTQPSVPSTTASPAEDLLLSVTHRAQLMQSGRPVILYRPAILYHAHSSAAACSSTASGQHLLPAVGSRVIGLSAHTESVTRGSSSTTAAAPAWRRLPSSQLMLPLDTTSSQRRTSFPSAPSKGYQSSEVARSVLLGLLSPRHSHHLNRSRISTYSTSTTTRDDAGTGEAPSRSASTSLPLPLPFPSNDSSVTSSTQDLGAVVSPDLSIKPTSAPLQMTGLPGGMITGMPVLNDDKTRKAQIATPTSFVATEGVSRHMNIAAGQALYGRERYMLAMSGGDAQVENMRVHRSQSDIAFPTLSLVLPASQHNKNSSSKLLSEALHRHPIETAAVTTKEHDLVWSRPLESAASEMQGRRIHYYQVEREDARPVISHIPNSTVSFTSTTSVLRMLEEPSEKVSAVLSKIERWHFDAFELAAVSDGRPLSFLAFFLFKRHGLLKRFQLDEIKLLRFLHRVEEGYPNNPYHCRIHAADVLRSLHVVLTKGGVLSALAACSYALHKQQVQSIAFGNAKDQRRSIAGTKQGGNGMATGSALMMNSTDILTQGDNFYNYKLFVCYVAAIVHDFEHRGVNNDYLIRTGDPLAIRYNDISPMENHHLAAAFQLLNENQYAFIPTTHGKLKKALRKDVIDLVLATDMKQHFALVGLFTTSKVSSTAAAGVAGPYATSRSGKTRCSQSHDTSSANASVLHCQGQYVSRAVRYGSVLSTASSFSSSTTRGQAAAVRGMTLAPPLHHDQSLLSSRQSSFGNTKSEGSRNSAQEVTAVSAADSHGALSTRSVLQGSDGLLKWAHSAGLAASAVKTTKQSRPGRSSLDLKLLTASTSSTRKDTASQPWSARRKSMVTLHQDTDVILDDAEARQLDPKPRGGDRALSRLKASTWRGDIIFGGKRPVLQVRDDSLSQHVVSKQADRDSSSSSPSNSCPRISPPHEGSDSKQHFSLVSSASHLPMRESDPATLLMTMPWDVDTQMLALKIAFKCADLGHLASILEVHRKWVSLLEEEMFLQGDLERVSGLQGGVSPLMDRTKGGITRSQCGFFNVVAMPMFSALAHVFPSAVEMLHNLNSNFEMWSNMENAAGTSASINAEAISQSVVTAEEDSAVMDGGSRSSFTRRAGSDWPTING
ncbi:hypothetical protein CEUSTIGMA_g5870.t1 [Chlamydomonas eustigma]|uniref:Phosphodiesterase n=1 Tax=Chlamydomonas eustigma TaxID=1157962 RepID=A0A250X670_9CHLO|nr:hypothetical protein CEUSTIGMA_g5870.t1 [Chlamydomonas eustigma]|eukprot:GAX78429.1 hypothetical protein CEUSTIGMA_g5870.t1 [Chlamydomonas eustigma]